MPNWFPFSINRKADPEFSIASAVPLVNDLSSVVYPEDNYKNFAKEGYSRSAVVNACIRELSTGAATAKYFVQVETPDGFEVVKNSPLAQLIKYPNNTQDFYHWIERLVTYLYVSGNAYVLKERSRGNVVTGLYLLRPDRVSIMPSGEGVKGYSYEIDGKEYFLEPEDVGHLSFPNPNGDLYGLSPLHVLARTINLDLSMTDFAKMYFQNAGVPSGLLKVKRRLTNQDEANRIRNRWRSSFGGTQNFHKIAILDDDAEYQQMASAPSDMALTELHYHTESRICSVLGVPPILISANVGLARSTFANYKEARLSFHSETLEPLINKVIRFLNFCVGYEFDEEISADFSEMRSFMNDKDTDNARATALFTAGIITLNEARELVGQESIPDGEVRRLPTSMVESVTPSIDVQLPTGFSGVLSAKTDSIAPRGRKMGEALDKERDNLVDKYEPRIRTYYKGIKSRVNGIIGRNLERDVDSTKAFPFTATDLVPDSQVGDLSEVLFRMFTDIAQNTVEVINESGVAGEVAFSDTAPFVTKVTTQAPVRAQLIHRTVRKDVKKMMDIAFERGYSLEKLAMGVPDEKFAGIKSLLNEAENRARTVARTETMRAQNQTTNEVYRAQGFEYVRASDVDGSPYDTFVPAGDPYGRTCIERDGQIYRIEDAVDIEDHPNGTLSWVPMPRNYQPEGVTV